MASQWGPQLRPKWKCRTLNISWDLVGTHQVSSGQLLSPQHSNPSHSKASQTSYSASWPCPASVDYWPRLVNQLCPSQLSLLTTIPHGLMARWATTDYCSSPLRAWLPAPPPLCFSFLTFSHHHTSHTDSHGLQSVHLPSSVCWQAVSTCTMLTPETQGAHSRIILPFRTSAFSWFS
jgi:hypothetical protein